MTCNNQPLFHVLPHPLPPLIEGGAGREDVHHKPDVVWGLGLGDCGLGFRVWGFGIEFVVEGWGLRVAGWGFGLS